MQRRLFTQHSETHLYYILKLKTYFLKDIHNSL